MRTYSQIDGDGGSGRRRADRRPRSGDRAPHGRASATWWRSARARAASARARSPGSSAAVLAARGQARGHPRRRSERAEPGAARRRARTCRRCRARRVSCCRGAARACRSSRSGSLLAEGEALDLAERRRRPHARLARHPRVREARRAAGRGRLGAARRPAGRSAAGSGAHRPVRRLPGSAGRGGAGLDPVGAGARGRGALGRRAARRCPTGVLGYVENMSGYACAGCGTVRPLFPEEPRGRRSWRCRLPRPRALRPAAGRALAIDGRRDHRGRRQRGPGRRGARRGRRAV